MPDIYEMRAEVAKALAHHTRLRIIESLINVDERCVCDIVGEIDESQSSISKHLGILKDVGLVESRKEGLKVFYKLRVPCIANFFDCIDKVLMDDLQCRQVELFGDDEK